MHFMLQECWILECKITKHKLSTVMLITHYRITLGYKCQGSHKDSPYRQTETGWEAGRQTNRRTDKRKESRTDRQTDSVFIDREAAITIIRKNDRQVIPE
ncbi:hypothetical protein DPMN_115835 [Dreissena polymorpha]|uniref:Uncharacterized protein n=1 Tax=Dreissena polymorpha TaxID=45954 RepID=A0A9D4QTB4_DREPO|nr:hypothetical protein DPMN_115835 [Dreissena polymorpha]